MKVLHVNVRLQEGGAARIALDLHRQLLKSGVESRFAYGWGEKGGKSSAEPAVAQNFRVGRQAQVAGNILLHRLTGMDILPPVGAGQREMVTALDWADIIHLHVIHSYYLPLGWLTRELTRVGKPVVWTAHDYWMVTGRCAFTEGCEAWRQGCGACPSQHNYPPSWFDFSAFHFKAKRKLIGSFGKQLHVVAPSMFVADAIGKGLPNVKVCAIPNWLDSEFEAALQAFRMKAGDVLPAPGKIKVLVIANDLSDPTKIDAALVNQLLKMPHIEIHAIGKNSPFTDGLAINYGRIDKRSRMVEVMSSADVTLFTSEKDTFGLVMVEALACGVPVLAVDSLAAREVLGGLGIGCISRREMIAILSDSKVCGNLLKERCTVPEERLLMRYRADSAAAAYRSLYEKCISERQNVAG